jgi:hypothetical protein
VTSAPGWLTTDDARFFHEQILATFGGATALIYHVGVEVAHVLAVAHLHRRPGYWRGRREE